MELVGRGRELALVRSHSKAANRGEGRLLLIAGEIGVGKTSLARAGLQDLDIRTYLARANQTAPAPFAPLLAVLRHYLRDNPGSFAELEALLPYLARLLPELGEAIEGDRATQDEALASAFRAMSAAGPCAIILDDLQWADNATLDFMPSLAMAIRSQPILVMGVYRNDQINSNHGLLRAREDLRRAHLLEEIELGPLGAQDSERLAQAVLGRQPGPELAGLLHDRSQGVPLYLEKLCSALLRSEVLVERKGRFELRAGKEVPLPASVRAASLLRVEGLSTVARALLEAAAVVGNTFDPDLVHRLAAADGDYQELLDQRLLIESDDGALAFRHTLTREAIYAEIAWSRKRELHRRAAVLLEEGGAPKGAVADHLLAGGQLQVARKALLASAERSCQLFAHQDAIRSYEKALEIWPEGEDELTRLEVLDSLANCAELCGRTAEAILAWREVAEVRMQLGDGREYAEVQRKIANAYEIQGSWEQANMARLEAADAFAESSLPGEAASERLAVAAHLSSGGSFGAGLELVSVLLEEARAAGRADLQARGMGLQGALMAKTGDIEAGHGVAQRGLSLALDHDMTGAAAEVYQRLASVVEQSSEYEDSVEVYQEAFNYCARHEEAATGNLCLACLAVVLRQIGEWEEAERLCNTVLQAEESEEAVKTVARTVLGLIEAARGRVESARGLLSQAVTVGRFQGLASCEILGSWGLAIASAVEGDQEGANSQSWAILERWSETEDLHYAISPLRWACSYLATSGDGEGARACADALSRIASIGELEALAGLAHALGELALLDRNHEQAIHQFQQALELLLNLDIPYDQAATRLRLGTALIEAHQRPAGLKHLVESYRIARDLLSRDLMDDVTKKMQQIGEEIEKHLGSRAAYKAQHAGLTKRQMQVLGLVAEGLTNREVAEELVLSTRTVDMHVRNILDRLDCRSRTEAVKKAAEQGLLGEASSGFGSR